MANLPIQRFSASKFGLERLQDNSLAGKTRIRYIQHFNGGLSDRWSGVLTFSLLQKTDVPKIKAWLVGLRGTLNTFEAFDPDRIRPRGAASPSVLITADMDSITAGSTTITADSGVGVAYVNGASQVGRSLSIDGMPASTTAYLKAGDYFQLGAGYHMVTADVDTDGSGAATINFEPILRASPADNAQLKFDKPVMVARLDGAYNEVATDMNSMSNFSFAFIEDL